jgi:hypothetical protein
MDPMEKDPDKSYGRELKALRNRDTLLADHELEREISELKHRIGRADFIASRLGILAGKEAAKRTA